MDKTTRDSRRVKIIDSYKHLNFWQLESVDQLKPGMMVQVVEANKRPLRWEWCEVNESLVSIIRVTPQAGDFVRIPCYEV